MLSVRLGPSLGGWRSASATSSPRLLTTTRRKPSWPISSRLYCDSMPAWPTSAPGAQALELRQLQLALRDLAHAAERVRGGRGERVGAQRHHLDAHLGQLEPPRLERGDVGERRVGLHHHRAVGLAPRQPLADRRLAHAERRREPRHHAGRGSPRARASAPR